MGRRRTIKARPARNWDEWHGLFCCCNTCGEKSLRQDTGWRTLMAQADREIAARKRAAKETKDAQ